MIVDITLEKHRHVPACIATICDATGYARDEVRTIGSSQPESFLDLVSEPDRGRAGALLSSDPGRVADTVLDFHGTSLHTYVVSIDDDLRLVTAARESSEIVHVCEQIAARMPEHAIAASMIAVAAMPSASAIARWDEFSRLNNELASAHRELSQANAELRRLNAEKNQLLGIAAHDLRSPLAAVSVLCELLQDGGLSEKERQTVVDQVGRSTKMMLSLVEQVLSVTAIEHGTVTLHREHTDLCTIADDVLSICRPLADRRQVLLRTEHASRPAKVNADSSKLFQIIQNLLTNAIAFSPAGGECVVSTARVGNAVTITVRDSGPGIDTGQLPHLFQPFVHGPTPSGGRKGTGLGLAIVRRLVQAHGGSIEAASVAGSGTEMRVTLPAV